MNAPLTTDAQNLEWKDRREIMGHIQWIIDIYQQIDAHEGETSDVFVTAHGGRLGMRGWGDGGWSGHPSSRRGV